MLRPRWRRASQVPTNLESMQVLGHINGIAHHERNRPVAPVDHPAMTAVGRRKIIATLIGQADWTAGSIAEALAISEAVINADLEEIGLDFPASSVIEAPAVVEPEPIVVVEQASLVRDGGGRFVSDPSPLLEAFITAGEGLSAAEIAGLEPAAASKRLARLHKRGLIDYALDETGSLIKRGNYLVYVITEQGRRRVDGDR